MITQEKLVQSGHWLFRWRSYTPLIVVLLCALQTRHFAYLGNSHATDLLWEGICMFVGALGLGIRIHVAGHVPGKTSGRNTRGGQQAETLNTTGLYSLVRNPLYVGNFFLWLGASMFLHNAVLVALVLAIFLILYERIILAEEEFLLDRFADEYRLWAAKTPAVIPRWGSRYRAPNAPFSLRTALRREHSSAFGFIAVLFTLEWLGDWFHKGAAIPDRLWLWGFGLCALAYATIRTLKNHTRLLHVEGRA